MNRMTRTIAKLFVLTCCCLMLANAATAAEAAPKKSAAKKKAASPNSCAYLDILFETSTTAQVRSSGVACDHGNLSSIEPSQEDTKLVGLQQSASYGPDCTVTVTWAGGQKTAVIRGQQNFCALSAGNIIASVVSGPATITRIETGAYGKRPGRVYVRLNN